MIREQLLETLSPLVLGANLSGTISAAAGGVAVVGAGGSDFVNELSPGDIISVIDNTGKRIYKTVDNIGGAAALNVCDNFTNAVAAGSNYQKPVISSPYFFASDATATQYPNKVPVYMPPPHPTNANVGKMLPPNALRAAIPTYWISQNEGILIKSVYLRLPYQYTMADGPISISFFYYDERGLSNARITNLGNNGAIFAQVENIEIPVNTYVPPWTLAVNNNVRWGIAAFIEGATDSQDDYGSMLQPNMQGGPYVSIVDAPAALAGELLTLAVGMRITHGYALTT